MKYNLSILFCLFVFIVKSQISVNTNFAPAISAPLDNRTVLTNLSDTLSLNFKYEGMLIYITALDKFYVYETTWKEFFADASTTVRGLVNTTSQSYSGNKTFSEGAIANSTATNIALITNGITASNWNVYTSNQTLDWSNNFVEIGQLTGQITLTLPACTSTYNGIEYNFLKTGTDNFAAVILRAGSDTFTDGASQKFIYSRGNSVSCKCRFNAGVGTWFYTNN